MTDSASQESGAASGDGRTAQDGATTRDGRRALMLGAAAAGAGITVGLVAGAKPAGATNGQAVVLGQNGSNANTATSTTQINTMSGDGLQANTTGDADSHGILGTATAGTGVQGQTTGDNQSGVSGIDTSTNGGYGVYGRSTSGYGVYGETQGDNGYGVYANDASQGGATALHGTSTRGNAVAGFSGKGNGVVGLSTEGYGVAAISEEGIGLVAAGTSGVLAVGLDNGYGVKASDTITGSKERSTPVFAEVANTKNGNPAIYAWTGGRGSALRAAIDNTKNSAPAVSATSNGTGPAVLAYNPEGMALQVEGIASFSRSGHATVAGTTGKPSQSVVVTGVALSRSSLILVTPQGRVAGVGIEGVVADAKAKRFTVYLTEPITVSLAIAWFVIG